MILQLDQQFSGHAEAVVRLSSFHPANVVTANFCEVEPAVNLFIFIFTGATDKSQSSVSAVAKILSKSFCCCDLEKSLQGLPTGYYSCNKNTTQYSSNSFSLSYATVEQSVSTLQLIKSDLQTSMVKRAWTVGA